MPLWKRILLRSFGLGLGLALALCIAVAVWSWYRTRPQPWNTAAIKAKYATLDEQTNADSLILNFGYDLENATRSSYVIDKANWVLFARLSDTNALSKSFGMYQSGEATIEAPAFIPAKATVRIDIHVPYSYAGFEAPNDKNDTKKFFSYLGQRVTALSGFVIFDQANHYRIDLPSGWQNMKP